MKIFVSAPVAVATSRGIRQPQAIRYRLASKRSLLQRFQHFIESTDWEDRYLCNSVTDKICLGIIVVSVLYFIPVLGWVMLR